MSKTIGVIGAGIMGNGIAQVSAAAGLNVIMVDINDAALERGLASIAASLDKLVKKDKISAAEREATLARISRTTDYGQLATADLVIEAATENLEIKKRILKQADGVMRADAILATNTSSISITELAASTTRPDRFVGLHFFNPVPLMQLVEVISGLATSQQTQESIAEFARAIGKAPIGVRNSPGFAVNRILCPMINEAIFTLQEGVATAEDIDTGMKLGCGHPIGPLALADLVGLDTLLSVMEVFYRDFGDTKYRPAPLLREMVAAGRYGRKSGEGFYKY
ncbi:MULTISPECIES: 3-hydroxybutyryl-CoA dehydrogenase [Hydrocarboniphaga]|uniref:3-hydroxybutyryl-CoA dehydrogenase n=1 Tax=Hydrocarboniphaga effusa AP103 TaxID=1172194 RepID=I8T4C6_9GAMM|nr:MULTISPECIES: 3-hydroxybutyryl-CoA dehydrogenase [Hydrocarboniphaga]EIT68553.1 3-hydroxybutyryl-CoA dehydrogenase [Hydrocarboniphaga effusa AP103]MDZ4077096.1 3-hydroxybutyryl-CoA dehydrogenase [Hydrocarboniphaga sp.]